MANIVAPEFERFVARQREVGLLPKAVRAAKEGEVFEPLHLNSREVAQLMRVAARLALGLAPASRRSQVVWVEAGNELALRFTKIHPTLSNGVISIAIPVRCDQTGTATVQVLFAMGSPEAPAGLYASTTRVPLGPSLIVSTWGNALVAFAWQCLLGLATGVTGAIGRDAQGDLLLPVEMAVSADGITVVPMARHRFSGETSLLHPTRPR